MGYTAYCPQHGVGNSLLACFHPTVRLRHRTRDRELIDRAAAVGRPAGSRADGARSRGRRNVVNTLFDVGALQAGNLLAAIGQPPPTDTYLLPPAAHPVMTTSEADVVRLPEPLLG